MEIDVSPIWLAVLPLMGTVVGAIASFGGVAYAERRRDERAQARAVIEREQQTLLAVQDAIDELEEAAGEALIEIVEHWQDNREWVELDYQNAREVRYVRARRAFRIAISRIKSDELRHRTEAWLRQVFDVVKNGPKSSAPEDVLKWKGRAAQRSTEAEATIEAVGEEYRSLG